MLHMLGYTMITIGYLALTFILQDFFRFMLRTKSMRRDLASWAIVKFLLILWCIITWSFISQLIIILGEN